MNNVLEYLELTASRLPDRTACADEAASYTFSELRNIAGRLGQKIGLHISAANEPVGVIADRSAATLVRFMGVLFAGCCYVPLDPEAPDTKLLPVLEETGMQVILGGEEQRGLIERLHFQGTYISALPEDGESASIPDTAPEDPLCLIYTSGSTGRPKGILKSHACVINFIDAYTETFDFEGDVIGNQTPFYFDASAKDIYLMLKGGCTLEVLPTRLFSLPKKLVEYMNERKVSFISWVPSALSIIVQMNTFKSILPEYLKKVFFVGEVMPMKYLNKWRAALPDLLYVNLYGQSEIAGICCFCQVSGNYGDDDVLPIGKPLKNSRILLIKDGKEITTPGETGEIVIRSGAVATEYYHDPEKTAVSFLPAEDGQTERGFKTGDLARYDADGSLVFASRADSQIKHMGHRIELGEIEAVALTIPEIRRCCCVYEQKKSKIILFAELFDDAALTEKEIRILLRDKLVNYMQPKQVILLDTIPQNANGKIDRPAVMRLL